MATTRLTQARIAALRPRKTTIGIRDATLKGFGIRVYLADADVTSFTPGSRESGYGRSLSTLTT